MPKVRLTYERDIRREGKRTLEVDDERARLLIDQRRAVLVESEDELADLDKEELLARAAEVGVEDVSSRMTREKLIQAIRDAEAGG